MLNKYLLLVLVIIIDTRHQCKRKNKSFKNPTGFTAQEVDSILNAYSEMYSYCQENFRKYRWNCPMPSRISDANYPISLTALYPLATKETSYVYSLTAAAIVHHLINACLAGKAKKCPCIKSKDNQVVNCPKNLDFGFKRGKRIIKIMDYRQIHDERRKIFNLKNSLIGIQIYKENLPTRCRCHGTSGACATKTCWKTTPINLKQISVKLKEMYDKAKKLQMLEPRDVVDGLTYINDSPDYCKKNIELGIPGTLNRECDHNDKDSCSNLCSECGHRKHSYSRTVQVKCDCKFVWCCSVQCNLCEKRKVMAKCEKSL